MLPWPPEPGAPFSPLGPAGPGKPVCPVAPVLPGKPRGPRGPRGPWPVGGLLAHRGEEPPTLPVNLVSLHGGRGLAPSAAKATLVETSRAVKHTASTPSLRDRKRRMAYTRPVLDLGGCRSSNPLDCWETKLSAAGLAKAHESVVRGPVLGERHHRSFPEETPRQRSCPCGGSHGPRRSPSGLRCTRFERRISAVQGRALIPLSGSSLIC